MDGPGTTEASFTLSLNYASRLGRANRAAEAAQVLKRLTDAMAAAEQTDSRLWVLAHDLLAENLLHLGRAADALVASAAAMLTCDRVLAGDAGRRGAVRLHHARALSETGRSGEALRLLAEAAALLSGTTGSTVRDEVERLAQSLRAKQ
jgi:hypothetical protein